jgi:pilus assembly protein CpaB
MLGLAFFLAVASVYMARNWIRTQIGNVAQQEAPAPQIATKTVVVATAPISFGNQIRREHLRLVDWPEGSVPDEAFFTFEEVLGDANQDRRVALRTIDKNEPILKSKVSGFGGRASLSQLLAPDMRATTIPVNAVNGVAGFVLPGDRVDVLLTRRNESGGNKGLITDILLQNMKVLAIDQDANDERDKPSVVRAVTLEATTLQSQKLTLAQRIGTLSLTLRNVTNAEAEVPQTVSLTDLKVGEANDTPTVKGATDAKVVKASTGEATAAQEETTTVTTAARRNITNVNVVRGLETKTYEVTPEKPSFSKPAYSKPLDLLPSSLAPKIAVPASNVAPSSVVGGAAGSENVFGGFSTNEPVSLLPKATVPGTDG